MAFSSWSALKTALQDQLADNPAKLLNQSYRAPGGTQVTFRSLKEVMDFIRKIDEEIDSGSEGIAFSLTSWG